MGFKGNIENISLHQVINLIHQGKRSGILTILGYDAETRIIFRFGNMIHGSSTKQKENIIDFLIDQEILSSSYREKLKQGHTLNLSFIFQDLPQARRFEIIAALQARAKIVLFDTLFWDKGEFTFTDREINEQDFPRIEKMMSDVEQLEDQDLSRIIRLKQKIPFKETILKIDPDHQALLEFALSDQEKKLFSAFDGKKTLLEILPTLEGEELFNMLSILDLLESGTFIEEAYHKSPAPTAAWDQKFTDYLKVYEGSFKKISSFFQQYCGDQDRFFLKNAFQEAKKEYQCIWQAGPGSSLQQISLEAVRKNAQKQPLKHQVRLLKNSLNALLVWQLITLKNYAGTEALQNTVHELNAILSVLKQKGSINHQEIAGDIPMLFSSAEDFPSWVEQGILLYQLKRHEDCLSLFQNIPASHPEREKVQGYIDEIEQKRELAEKIELVILQIYKLMVAGNMPEVQKLMRVLQQNAPQHPELPGIKQEFAKRFDEIIKSFKDLSLIPQLNPEFDQTKLDKIRLSSEQKTITAVVDGNTDIKGIIAGSGFSKLKTLLILYSVNKIGLISVPEHKVTPPQPKPAPVAEKVQAPEPVEKAPPPEPVAEKPAAPQVSADPSQQQEDEASLVSSIEAEIELFQSEREDTAISPQPVASKSESAPQEDSVVPEKKSKADYFFSQGLEAMHNEDYELAIRSFEMAIKYFPAGVAYYQYLDRARSLYKHQFVHNLIESTKWYFAQNDFKQTAKYLKQALTLSGNNREILLLSVDIYKAMDQHDLVEKAYLSLIELEPAHADHYFSLGMFYLNKGDLVKARNQLLLTLQWQKNHADAQRQLNLLP
ncbi:DUF4388 domain-containing protein [candidate division CSSED10-310 bacterium]|uniref:DUF4388 domain-containing protein n=1 Tax=candidate division CSSED10-310 bacterium TaxID=2855610 RepID=A0ABV6YTN2_UNCC1